MDRGKYSSFHPLDEVFCAEGKKLGHKTQSGENYFLTKKRTISSLMYVRRRKYKSGRLIVLWATWAKVEDDDDDDDTTLRSMNRELTSYHI
jgi:hypothetical protein